MNNKFLIAPSILSADFANLEAEVNDVQQAGADWIHVDIMDGHFVPNITLGPPIVKALKAVSTIPLDCHLMIESPEKWIKPFVQAGANYLTIHIETTSNPVNLLQEIRNLGAHPGITLKPQTSVEEILPLLKFSDLVLIMTVNPGFSGQKFMNEQIMKIKLVKDYCLDNNLSTLIQVDGGINKESANQCINADILVAGDYIFKNPKFTYIQSISELKKIQKY